VQSFSQQQYDIRPQCTNYNKGILRYNNDTPTSSKITVFLILNSTEPWVQNQNYHKSKRVIKINIMSVFLSKLYVELQYDVAT